MPFEWIPGKGIDPDALERMKQHFPKPTKPTYEAWFISGTINYHHWLFRPVEELSSRDLAGYLFDTGGGVRNFGRREEWVLWFQYLLPHVLPRFEEESLLELLINYIFNLYPDGIIEEYPGFRDDILRTVGQAIMSPELWENGDLPESIRFSYSYWVYETSDIYCTLFFCLAYLHPDEIATWVASIAAIEGVLWLSIIAQWLTELQRFFDLLEHPENISDEEIAILKENYYEKDKDGLEWFLAAGGISWSNSFLIFNGLYSRKEISDYLPAANLEIFWREVKKQSVLARMLE